MIEKDSRVRRRTDGTIGVRKGWKEEIHWEGLVVCGDNTRFLTGRKSELREPPHPATLLFHL